jgi:hypothetical protein
MNARPTKQPDFATALQEALRHELAAIRNNTATLADSIASAPDDALPALADALKKRQQVAREPETKKRLLARVAEFPVSRRIAFAADETATGCYSDACLALEDPEHAVIVSVRDDVSPAIAASFLRLALHAIENDGALKGRDWDRLYARPDDGHDDDLPF